MKIDVEIEYDPFTGSYRLANRNAEPVVVFLAWDVAVYVEPGRSITGVCHL